MNSPFRAGLSEPLRENLDELSKPDQRQVLSVLSESASTFGYEVALESLQEAVRRGAVDSFSLQAISARIAYDGLLSSILKAQLLIIDEWGYVPIDKQGAQLLFRVISDSYERRSLIITTNLEFSKWGSIFTDDQMAAAMIDRLAHHGYILLFEGESYRMKNALMRQKR